MENQILYADYVDLIRRRAHYWSHFPAITEIDCSQWYEELFSIGNIAFCEAKTSYNPTKASFSTWLYGCLDIKMRNFLSKEKHKNEIDTRYIQYSNTRETVKKNNPNWFTDFANTLSEEAKEVVDAILNSPAEYMESILDCFSNIQDVKRFLAARGTKQIVVNNTIAEIRERLR